MKDIKFKRRGITQKKSYNIQNTAKVCNQEYFTSMGRKLQDTFDYSKYPSFLCCSMYFLCCSMYFCVVLCIFFVLFYVFFVLFYVFFVLFYVFLCCSMYCLFCVVLCIVCVYMCTELLPTGGYPIAVKYIISHHIKWHYSKTGNEQGAQRIV